MIKLLVTVAVVATLCSLAAPMASASVIGHLTVGICAGGGVIVNATSIDWEPGDPAACLNAGLDTSVTGAAGNITPGSVGTINDLPPLGGIFGFMTFGALRFDLYPVGGFGPGDPDSCAVNPAINDSCSIPGSPFILTRTLNAAGTPGTSVTLLTQGTILDSDGKLSTWNGAFTTQINNRLPASIQAAILAGQSITSTFSGEFDVTPIPESSTLVLIGAGLIGLASIKRRRRRA